jgi:transglutaminase-like putative cysteine protease
MKISVRQQLSIGFPAGIARGVLHLLLTPQSNPMQTVREWTVDMPGIAEAAAFGDGYGNRARLVSIAHPDAEVTISIAGIVETVDRNGVVGRPAGEPVPALYRRVTAATRPIAELVEPLRGMPREGGNRIALFHALMGKVGETLAGATQSQNQGDEGQTQSQGTAVNAAEMAHAFIGTARALGLPARYVNGFFAGSGKLAAGPHAWAEAWDDGLGWIAFDPLLNVCPTEGHIRVATGLDASSTVPVRTVPAGEPKVTSLEIEAG